MRVCAAQMIDGGIRAAFASFDLNCDGTLDAAEVGDSVL